MTSGLHCRVLTAVVACAAVLAGLASAHAGYIADWEFAEGSNFLADSSGNGHTLSQTYGATSVGSTGGVATFDGSQTLATNVDLTSYKKIRVSWGISVQSTGFGMVYSQNLYSAAGGIAADVNEFAVGTGMAGLTPTDGAWIGGGAGYNLDTYSNSTNSTLENFSVEYDLTAATAADAIKIFKGITPVGTDLMTSNVPTSFTSGLFEIGLGLNATGTHGNTGFVGQLDYMRIESVPEPSTIMLTVAGMLGLLAYAWRKR